MHQNAPVRYCYTKQNREVNTWDNRDFSKDVRATGKTQIIIAGITTDVSIANIYSVCMRYSQDPLLPGVHHHSRAFTHRRMILCSASQQVAYLRSTQPSSAREARL